MHRDEYYSRQVDTQSAQPSASDSDSGWVYIMHKLRCSDEGCRGCSTGRLYTSLAAARPGGLLSAVVSAVDSTLSDAGWLGGRTCAAPAAMFEVIALSRRYPLT